MSDDEGLSRRIHQALAEDLTNRGGGMVTGFYLVADVIDADGEHGWVYATAEDQPLITTLGLLDWALGCARYEQQRYLDDGGDL